MNDFVLSFAKINKQKQQNSNVVYADK